MITSICFLDNLKIFLEKRSNAKRQLEVIRTTNVRKDKSKWYIYNIEIENYYYISHVCNGTYDKVIYIYIYIYMTCLLYKSDSADE